MPLSNLVTLEILADQLALPVPYLLQKLQSLSLSDEKGGPTEKSFILNLAKRDKWLSLRSWLNSKSSLPWLWDPTATIEQLLTETAMRDYLAVLVSHALGFFLHDGFALSLGTSSDQYPLFIQALPEGLRSYVERGIHILSSTEKDGLIRIVTKTILMDCLDLGELLEVTPFRSEGLDRLIDLLTEYGSYTNLYLEHGWVGRSSVNIQDLSLGQLRRILVHATGLSIWKPGDSGISDYFMLGSSRNGFFFKKCSRDQAIQLPNRSRQSSAEECIRSIHARIKEEPNKAS